MSPLIVRKPDIVFRKQYIGKELAASGHQPAKKQILPPATALADFGCSLVRDPEAEVSIKLTQIPDPQEP